MDAEVWRFLLQGGALAVLAALVLLVGPKLLDRRVEALEKLAAKWETVHERDRAQNGQLARLVLDRLDDVIAELTRIADELEGEKREGA